MTHKELVDVYNEFSDERLLEAYANRQDYTDAGQRALEEVVAVRGGLEYLLTRQEQLERYRAEAERIKAEVNKLYTMKTDPDFMVKMITSSVFEKTELSRFVRESLEEIRTDKEDRKIKPRTITGGLIGAILGGIIGGVLWGLQMMWSKRTFMLLFIGLVLLCYGLIKLFTRQSHKNAVVIVLTLAAVFIAGLVGQLMYMIFGRQ